MKQFTYSALILLFLLGILPSCNVTDSNDTTSMQHGLQLRTELSKQSVLPNETLKFSFHVRNYRIEDVAIITASPAFASISIHKEGAEKKMALNVPGSLSGGPGILGRHFIRKHESISIQTEFTMVESRYDRTLMRSEWLPLEPGSYYILVYPDVIAINDVSQRLEPIRVPFEVRAGTSNY